MLPDTKKTPAQPVSFNCRRRPALIVVAHAIFATDRLRVKEVVLAIPTEDAWYDCRNLGVNSESLTSLDALVRTSRTARNSGAAITLAWVDAANAAIRDERS